MNHLACASDSPVSRIVVSGELPQLQTPVDRNQHLAPQAATIQESGRESLVSCLLSVCAMRGNLMLILATQFRLSDLLILVIERYRLYAAQAQCFGPRDESCNMQKHLMIIGHWRSLKRACASRLCSSLVLAA